MKRGLRITRSVLLIGSGIALATFYYLLFAITDCSADCVAAGERAVPLGFVGAGIGMVVTGIALFRIPSRQAAGWGISSAGLVTAIGCILLFAEGSKGLAMWFMAGGLALIFVGGAIRRRRPTEGL